MINNKQENKIIMFGLPSIQPFRSIQQNSSNKSPILTIQKQDEPNFPRSTNSNQKQRIYINTFNSRKNRYQSVENSQSLHQIEPLPSSSIQPQKSIQTNKKSSIIKDIIFQSLTIDVATNNKQKQKEGSHYHYPIELQVVTTSTEITLSTHKKCLLQLEINKKQIEDFNFKIIGKSPVSSPFYDKKKSVFIIEKQEQRKLLWVYSCAQKETQNILQKYALVDYYFEKKNMQVQIFKQNQMGSIQSLQIAILSEPYIKLDWLLNNVQLDRLQANYLICLIFRQLQKVHNKKSVFLELNLSTIRISNNNEVEFDLDKIVTKLKKGNPRTSLLQLQSQDLYYCFKKYNKQQIKLSNYKEVDNLIEMYEQYSVAIIIMQIIQKISTPSFNEIEFACQVVQDEALNKDALMNDQFTKKNKDMPATLKYIYQDSNIEHIIIKLISEKVSYSSLINQYLKKYDDLFEYASEQIQKIYQDAILVQLHDTKEQNSFDLDNSEHINEKKLQKINNQIAELTEISNVYKSIMSYQASLETIQQILNVIKIIHSETSFEYQQVLQQLWSVHLLTENFDEIDKIGDKYLKMKLQNGIDENWKNECFIYGKILFKQCKYYPCYLIMDDYVSKDEEHTLRRLKAAIYSGKANEKLSKFDEALIRFEQAIRIANHFANNTGVYQVFKTLLKMGKAQISMKQYQKSLVNLQIAYNLIPTVNKQNKTIKGKQMSQLYFAMGTAFAHTSQLEKSIEYILKSLTILESQQGINHILQKDHKLQLVKSYLMNQQKEEAISIAFSYMKQMKLQCGYLNKQYGLMLQEFGLALIKGRANESGVSLLGESSFVLKVHGENIEIQEIVKELNFDKE